VSRRDGWACLLNSGYGSVMSRNLGSAGQLCDPHLGMEFNDGPRSHFRILLFQFCGVDVFLQILQKIEQFSNIVLHLNVGNVNVDQVGETVDDVLRR
jgi:hypothetical protein